MNERSSLIDKNKRAEKVQEYMNRVDILSKAYKYSSFPVCGILLLGCSYVISEELVTSVPLIVLSLVLALLLAVRVINNTIVGVVMAYYSLQSLRMVTYCKYADEKRSIFCTIGLKMMNRKGLGAELVCVCLSNGKRIGLYLPVLVEEG